LEALEPRIAPAGLAEVDFKATPAGSSILVKAGEGLATSDVGGSYLLYVEKGQALVFTTDLNANNRVDFNEITGISAGAGLKMTSFVDINGDIVTNLRSDGRLTDSDGNATNGYDGRVVLNQRIDSITLRSIAADELPAKPGETVSNRIAKSSYSIFGNVYVGGGLGTSKDAGLTIDTTGFQDQEAKWGILTLSGQGEEYPIPSIGYIFTGSATGGKMFSFGTSPDFGTGPTQSLRGVLAPFVAAAGQAGGDVLGIRAGALGIVEQTVVDPVTGESVTTEVETLVPTPFHISGVVTGNGGSGARGGDIVGVNIQGDIGGLRLETGNGGDGERGGSGGSIKGLVIDQSVNSKVFIQTGDGGDGLIGASGSAGQVQFNGEVDMMGRITIGLGRGGDAAGNAGPGTSITGSDFRDVKPGTYLPAQFITTWRLPGDLGDSEVFFDGGNPSNGVHGYVPRSIDFDDDGFADAVFLTDVPDQLVAAFGSSDPATPGTFDPQRAIYLDSPAYASAATRTSAVVVLDANADGYEDIATGQSAGNGYLGVMVHINKGFDPQTGEWLGFDLARYSPMPLGENLRDTTQAIVNLASGDFDRDGVVDLGVITVGRTANTSPPFFGALTVMSGLTAPDGKGGFKADGFFAADFDKGTLNVQRKDPVFDFRDFRSNQENFTFVLHATAAEAGNKDSDLLGVLSRGGRGTGESVVDGVGSGEVLNTFSMQPTAGVVKQTLTQDFAILRFSQRVLDGDPQQWVGYGDRYGVVGSEFVFLDADSNGIFDAVVVGQPTGPGAPSYLVAATLQGSYTDTGSAEDLNYGIIQPLLTDPGAPTSPTSPGGLYFGIALSEFRSPIVTVDSVLGNDLQNRQVLSMNAGNFTGLFSSNGQPWSSFDPNDAASEWEATFALNGIDLFRDNTPPQSNIAVFAVTGFGQYASAASPLGEFRLLSRQGGYTPVDGNGEATRTSFFDYYRPRVAVYPAQGFLTAGLENELAPGATFWGVVVPPEFLPDFSGNPEPLWFSLAASTLELAAGAGGWSLLGKGGAGGSIGGGTLTLQPDNTLRGSVNSFGHVLQGVTSGAGGFGILGGGGGGAISSLVATAQTNFVPPDVRVQTGIGGSSLLGAGGAAGNLSQFQLRTDLTGTLVILANNPPTITMTTASGGFGITGGAGGSIIGRNDITSADTNSDSTIAATGNGGYGAAKGGAGGAMTGVVGIFGNRGNVEAKTGSGGASAAGPGGVGGTLDLRPSPLANSLNRALNLAAGAGGDGLTGGRGGSILNFINEPSQPGKPATLIALAGHGGKGVTGAGGAGGGVSGFQVTVAAVGGIGLVSAGDGGSGSASIGGAGGEVRNATLTADAGASVVLAGAGGSGLRAGGAGGAIAAANVNSGALTDARVVAMAGAGGDAHGVTLKTIVREGSAPVAPFAAVYALGLTDGRGANGGSVSGFTQPQATQASTDLVAGNGGGTVNFGRISDLQPLVGRGGSMTDIKLAGNAGILDPNVAIRPYAADFAEQLRSGGITVINNDTRGVGNVGVVVGAGGFVRNDQPASGALSGSVQSFTAKNVMSMVAGSVDRIAAIVSVSGLQLQGGGTQIGVTKNFYINQNADIDPVTGEKPSEQVDPADRTKLKTLYFGSPVSPPQPVPSGFKPYVIGPSANGGGALIDGAIVTKSYKGPLSSFVFPG